MGHLEILKKDLKPISSMFMREFLQLMVFLLQLFPETNGTRKLKRRANTRKKKILKNSKKHISRTAHFANGTTKTEPPHL